MGFFVDRKLNLTHMDINYDQNLTPVPPTDHCLHDQMTNQLMSWCKWTGPRLNIKTVLSTYGDFHVKDKTAVRTSYL